MAGIVSEDVAVAHLRPLTDELLSALDCAVRLTRDHALGGLRGAHPSTLAGYISSAFDDECRARFANSRSVRLMWCGRQMMICYRGYIVCLKKMDRAGQFRRLHTTRAKRFVAQMPLFDGSPDVPRVTLGYRLNEVATSVQEAAFVYTHSCREHRWRHYLLGGRLNQVDFTREAPAPIVPATQPAVPRGPRFRLKSTAKKKTNTSSES